MVRRRSGQRERDGRQPKPKASTAPHPERSGRRAARRRGRSRRAPRTANGSRPLIGADPVELLEEQAASRVPELVPIRYGRMLVSPFTFFRGAAYPMAADLAGAPRTGLEVQLCGDAHLSNFGGFAAPDRRLVFSINDFDETLPGPFEWDVKRLVASFAVAGRDRGFDAKQRQSINLAVTRSYREAIRSFAAMSNLDLWYSRIDVDEIAALAAQQGTGKQLKRFERNVAKARSKDSLKAFAKLTTIVDGEPRIASDPPLIVPIEDVVSGVEQAELEEFVRGVIRSYRRTLSADRRRLLERYRYVHSARKVVGVGSVGTRAWIVLMLGRDENDPLFLQLKEAQASVLEPFLGKSAFAKHGQRVVEGQRLTQAASDIMLGWIRVAGLRRREPGLLHAPALGRQGLGAGRADEPAGDDGVRASSAATRSRRRTPAPGTRSRSRATSARATASIARWRRSPRPTPTRTNATTTPCERPSRPAASRPRPASDPRFGAGRARQPRVTSRRSGRRFTQGHSSANFMPSE